MAAAESERPVDVVVGVVSAFLSGPGNRLDLVMPNMFMVDASWQLVVTGSEELKRSRVLIKWTGE